MDKYRASCIKCGNCLSDFPSENMAELWCKFHSYQRSDHKCRVTNLSRSYCVSDSKYVVGADPAFDSNSDYTWYLKLTEAGYEMIQPDCSRCKNGFVCHHQR